MAIPPQVYTPVQDISAVYDRLHSRFATGITKSLDYRVYNLKQLAYLLHDNEARIQACLKKDLDKGAFDASLSDLFAVYNEIDLALRRLPGWMKDEGRSWDSQLFFLPFIKRQPKGVALIIGPWNFPWQCSLGPLVGAIAAGCPAILKPSELAPSSAALIAELIPQYLDAEAYAVIQGGVDQTTDLLARPWGHIMFTGSTRVGKIVATAAAKTLTPTTLELGGKSPMIVSSDANAKITARRVLSMKPIGNAQVCVAPDYILCVKDKLPELLKALKETNAKFFPPSPHPKSALHTPITCALLSDASFDRMEGFLSEAEAKGKEVYRGESDRASRRMGMSFVVLNDGAKGEEGGLVEEEIFGPVMPIIPVKDVEEAIQYVNARPKPLALYVCSSKKSVFTKVVDETLSGSASWNDFNFVPVTRSVPFGGVGASGWGHYHGFDGFKTFSHDRAILESPYILEPVMSVRYGQAHPLVQKIISLLLKAPITYARPVSVESERRRRQVRGMISWTVTLAVVLAAGYVLQTYLGVKSPWEG